MALVNSQRVNLKLLNHLEIESCQIFGLISNSYECLESAYIKIMHILHLKHKNFRNASVGHSTKKFGKYCTRLFYYYTIL